MKCLNPKCDRPEKVRGLCWSCYQSCRRLVARNEITWDALESAGRVTKRKPHNFKKTTTINWLLTGRHIDELEYQETGKITPSNDALCQLELELQAANDMLARIHEICDAAGIPKTDGDVPTLEILFCEGHRVKLMAERLAAVSNGGDERQRPETKL